jgi:hypothetical protein
VFNLYEETGAPGENARVSRENSLEMIELSRIYKVSSGFLL